MKNFSAIMLAGAGALALAACSKNDETTTNTYTTADTTVANVDAMSDNAMVGMPVTLTPTQRQARQALNMQAYETEYRGYEAQPIPTETVAATPTPSASGTATSGMTGGTGAMAGTAGSAMSGNPNATTAPGNMSFAQLDRNRDGKLSVAEYAIYAVGVNPQRPVANDQQRPHATADQLNRAADTFFQYDTDGNTYLSNSEFAAAQRAGAASQTR